MMRSKASSVQLVKDAYCASQLEKGKELMIRHRSPQFAALIGFLLITAPWLPAAHAQDPIADAFARGDFAAAAAAMEEQANAGDFQAQAGLALLYSGARGAPIEPDPEKALFWMKQAVAQEDKAIAAGLGSEIVLVAEAYRGDAVDGVDAAYAIDWYALAANLGDADAGFQLGRLLLEGLGEADPNPDLAREWFEWAAPDHLDARLALADMHVKAGEMAQAVDWLDLVDVWPDKDQASVDKADQLLHSVYASVMPEPFDGWKFAESIQHEKKGASTLGDELVYPINVVQQYQYKDTNRKIDLYLMVNDAETAAAMTDVLRKAHSMEDAFAEAYKKENPGAKAPEPETPLYYHAGGREAFFLAKTDNNKFDRLYVVANDHLVVQAVALDLPAAAGLDDMLELMDRIDYDRLVDTLDRHGRYRKDEDGNLIK